MASPTTHHNIAIWVAGVSKGDATSFRLLYEHFHRDLYRFALHVVKSGALAEDVVHDVFVRIWEKRDQLDPARSFKSYLFTICRNRILNLLERAAYETQILDEISRGYAAILADDSEGNNFVVEREQLLRDAIDKLPPQRRQIFELAKLNGLSYEEIARQLQISRGTVSDHIVKANRFVRAYLQTHATLQVLWFLLMGKQ